MREGKGTGSLMQEEMDNLKGSEDHARNLLSDCKRRIQELELELAKRKESESNLLDLLEMQTRELEQSKILLQDSKLEIASLNEKLQKLQGFDSKGLENGVSKKEIVKGSETEVQSAKKKSVAEEDEKQDSEMVKSPLKELSLLRNELKLATEAEEKSKRAMDDLALALKEVATEASEVKEKLTINQLELEHSKGEAESLRVLLKSTEDNYNILLDETRKEADRYKNTAERLRLEAEESLLAWNGKETEFVNCIKKAEDERSSSEKNTAELLESLRVLESKINESKEDNQKLRDILKQALNEANVAREAAGIARAENAQLQDGLAGKLEALNLLAQENEILRNNEVTLLENIRELKLLLVEAAAAKELKNEDRDKSWTKGRRARAQSTIEFTETKDGRNLGFEKQEIEALRSDEFDQLGESPLDDTEIDGNSRKRRALLRRFGDILRRRGYQRKEPSIE